MVIVTWTDAPNGSAAQIDGVLVCQVRRLGVGGWSAAWRNGMTRGGRDQLTHVKNQASRHFQRRARAERAVEDALI